MSLAYSNALIAIFFFFLVLLQDVRALLAATVDGLDLDRGLLAPPLLVSPDEGADHGDGAEDARPEEESSTGAGLRCSMLLSGQSYGAAAFAQRNRPVQ